MVLNPHQFVGQQLWYVRGTSKRGPITVGTVEENPDGYFISDPTTRIRYPIAHGELHQSEESADEAVKMEKASRKKARESKKARQQVPDTSDGAQLARFLGVPPKKGK